MPRRLAQHLLFAILGSLLLSGCAVGPRLDEVYEAPPELPPGQARIYFYRSIDAFLIARETEYVVNDQRVGQAISGAVFFRDAQPGRYKIHTVDDASSVVYLSLEAGETAYVRAQSQWGELGFAIGLVLVEPALGQSESAGLVFKDGLEVESAVQAARLPPLEACCEGR